MRHGLRDALLALELGDAAVAQRVIDADDEVDRLCLALDRDAEILLVGKVVPGRTSRSCWPRRASRATSSAWPINA